MAEGYIVIGRVSRPHGTRGEVRVEYFNRGDPQTFACYKQIYLRGPEGELCTYRLSTCRPHKGFVLVKLEGINSRGEAEKLRGKDVLVDRDALPQLAPDEYYWQDLLGMRVVTEQGVEVGWLQEIFPTGSNDVYVVRKGDKEWLIPAIKRVIRVVDKVSRTIVIHPVEGLFTDDL